MSTMLKDQTIPRAEELAELDMLIESGEHVKAIELISHMISHNINASLETYLLATKKRLQFVEAA